MVGYLVEPTLAPLDGGLQGLLELAKKLPREVQLMRPDLSAVLFKPLVKDNIALIQKLREAGWRHHAHIEIRALAYDPAQSYTGVGTPEDRQRMIVLCDGTTKPSVDIYTFWRDLPVDFPSN